MSTLLVLDIGGTTVKLGFVAAGVPQTYVRLFPSAQLRLTRPVAALARMISIVVAEAAMQPDRIVATVPGFLDTSSRRVLFAANLPELNGCALAGDLQHAVGLPVLLERDVILSLMGEYAAGACKGSPSVLGVFFGTGVGAAYLADGKPFRGSGWALELGHMPYSGSRRWIGAERAACLEAFVSGKVLESIAKEHGIPVAEIFASAAAPGPAAHIEEFVQNQANAVATAIALLSPATVVLGGGICAMPCFPRDRLITAIEASFPFEQTGQPLDVRWAELGWQGVLHGAALVASAPQQALSSEDEAITSFRVPHSLTVSP